MCVVSGDTAAVVDNHQIAIAVIPTGVLDDPRLARSHRVTPASFYVDSRMELSMTSERIATIAETASNAHRRRNDWMFLVFRFKLRIGFLVRIRGGNFNRY